MIHLLMATNSLPWVCPVFSHVLWDPALAATAQDEKDWVQQSQTVRQFPWS